VIGEDVASCLYDLHYVEVAARDQWLAFAANRPLRLISEEVIEHAARQMVEEREMAATIHLAAMMRRLDRENPGYDA
jgi:hypothetical protein